MCLIALPLILISSRLAVLTVLLLLLILESCLEGVNRQVKTFSTKTRNKLGKTSSTGFKTSSTGLHELN
jgi:hypothetical protein